MMISIVPSHAAFRALSSALFCAMIVGCNVGPKYQPPAMTAPPVYKESPTQFKEQGDWTVAQPQDSTIRGNWWEIFNDPELNALEDQLEGGNQSIRMAFENFMQARALVREARSQYFPTISVGPSYSRQATSANIGSGTVGASGTGSAIPAQAGRQVQVFSLPAEISWAPDLWGRVRNTVHSQQYNAQLSAADLESERLTEQATLAEDYFQIRGTDALQKLLNDTVEADKQALDIAKGRYDTGVDTEVSVVEAETTLESVQSSALNVGIARAQYEHAIALLLGKPASQFSIPVRPMTTAPPPIPIGVPSQLLERRPDVAAAERTMAATNAQIGVARAAFFPTLTLSATGGFETSAIKHIVDWPSRFWSVGPSLSETVYDAGLRRATVNQYIATYNANLASYRQSVLTAFQQVEDYLATVRILSQQIRVQRSAVDSSQAYVKLEQSRYETGIDPYVDLVIAQTTLLSNQQTLTNLEIQQMTAAVELVQALGGGWDRSQLPTPSQVTTKPAQADTTIGH